VLFNDYGYLSGVWDFGLEFKPAIGYLLPDTPLKRIFICETRSGRVLPRWHGEPERHYCERANGSVAVVQADGVSTALEDAAVGRLAVNGDLLVEGAKLELDRTTLPPRVVQLFSAREWRPTESMFRRQEYTDRYECRFEPMWGYATPCRTFGFFDVQPNRAMLGSSFAWIGETRAGFIFDIAARQTAHRLLVEVQQAVSPAPKIRIRLNGVEVPAKWHNSTRLEATFPGDQLLSANNVLEFETEIDGKLGYSVALRGVSVTPMNDKRAEPAWRYGRS
jgi:hypothetical protein